MTIRVIELSTAEREEETRQLFLQCKPYLDKGMSLHKVVKIVKQINHTSFYNQAWFKELREYAMSHGYSHKR